ncbi:hypothetical protein MMC27_008703 [Xylographa pallens]|nr:hypothetical protein [Xylographa pallens]
MAYPPPQGNLPPYGAPYGAPPPGQAVPQGYPPPASAYGQQPGYPPQQFGQQPQGYPPHQQSYGMPGVQPQQFGQQYPGSAPQQYPPYGATSAQPQQFTANPHGQYGNPQQQFGMQQYGSPTPTPPSPGYGPNTMPVNDATAASAADALRKAMKGMGTDEAALIRTLCHYPGPLIPHLKQTYQQRHKRNLESDVASETRSNFEFALLSILRGPLQQDVFLLNKSLKGLGTNEDLLNDVLIARSNADLNAIKQAYQSTYHHTLESAVSDDLSALTKRLFSMVLSATRQEESAPVLPQSVDGDVEELHRSTEGKHGTDELKVCSVLSSRSDGQIRAIALAYEAKYRLSLEKVLAKEFSGHMKTALVQMVRAGSDRAMRDAVLLEDAMAGLGTKDDMLVSRVVRCHWDRQHMGQVKGAYKVKYGKDLVQRIKGETSGDYQKLLVAMVE